MKREYTSPTPELSFGLISESEDELDFSPSPTATVPYTTTPTSTPKPTKKAKSPSKSPAKSKSKVKPTADVSNNTTEKGIGNGASISPGTSPRKTGVACTKESWTTEKKRIVVEMMLEAGAKGVNLDMMSEQTGLTKQQLRDALKKRTDGGTNLRSQLLASFNTSAK
ncbi:hypothetical protein I317_03682 [Kwoniella heveanensis CBS 569]|uniref:Myb-like domain-containing protein n=1 Tax=Kwoniella heveanensis BCC8398 TaxID=1296120 RepID=A0A1B9GQW4_9TREE|nr:hypothetical protein I316_04996 [Kwoniella heveanensis BCC8398]OCF42437.1 hypothetical protein I317_03682 [Kwoniella heveanensis CBS 569]